MTKKTIIAAAVAATIGALGVVAGANVADAGVKVYVAPPGIYLGPGIYGPPNYYGGGYWGPSFYFGPYYHPRYYYNPRAPYHCHKWKDKHGHWKQKCHRHY